LTVGERVGPATTTHVGRIGKADKQVPPLRIAIDETNRNAPVGMTNSY